VPGRHRGEAADTHESVDGVVFKRALQPHRDFCSHQPAVIAQLELLFHDPDI